jgi:hypothetical protein
MDWKRIEHLLQNPKDLASENLSDLQLLSQEYPASIFPWMLIAGKNVQSGQEIPEDVWQRLLLMSPDKHAMFIWRKNGCTFEKELSIVNTEPSQENAIEIIEQPKDSVNISLESVHELSLKDRVEKEQDTDSFIPEIIGFSWDDFPDIISYLPKIQENIQPQTKENEKVSEIPIPSDLSFDLAGFVDHIGFEAEDISDVDLTGMISEITPTLATNHFKKMPTDTDNMIKETEIREVGGVNYEKNTVSKPDKETSFTDWLKQVSQKATTAQEWNASEDAGKHKKSSKKKFKAKKKGHVKEQKDIRKDRSASLEKAKKKKKKKSQLKEIIENSIQFEGGLVSETFAGLLAQQGHNERAIEMYEKLILIKPEKSSYFASRIKELKN